RWGLHLQWSPDELDRCTVAGPDRWGLEKSYVAPAVVRRPTSGTDCCSPAHSPAQGVPAWRVTPGQNALSTLLIEQAQRLCDLPSRAEGSPMAPNRFFPGRVFA